MGLLGLVLTCGLYPFESFEEKPRISSRPLPAFVSLTHLFSRSLWSISNGNFCWIFVLPAVTFFSQSKDSQCLEECFCSERLFLIQSQGNSASLVSLRWLLVTCCFLLLSLCSYFQWKFIGYQPLRHRQQWKSYRTYFVIESIY